MTVSRVPTRMPLNGLPVIFPMMCRIPRPANFCRPSLISFIPNRKTPMEPAKLMMMIRISVKSINLKNSFLIFCKILSPMFAP